MLTETPLEKRYYMHEYIKPFRLFGEMMDNKVEQTKDTIYRQIESNMNDQGYVPCLDIDPQFTREYISGDKFSFVMTVYGAHIGEVEGCSGIMGGKKIMRYTQKVK